MQDSHVVRSGSVNVWVSAISNPLSQTTEASLGCEECPGNKPWANCSDLTLEVELQGELQNSPAIPHPGDLPKVRVPAEVQIAWIVKLWVVQQVESFRPELEVICFVDVKLLKQGEVNVVERGSSEDVISLP